MAYEMRICYWSSDVCSADLAGIEFQYHVGAAEVGGRVHLLHALDRPQLRLQRLDDQALGVLRRNALVHHVHVEHRDVDVRRVFLGDGLVGDGAGHQDQHQRQDDRPAVGEGGVDDRVHDARSFSVSAMVASRSEEHTSELQSLMRISYAVFCLKKKKKII